MWPRRLLETREHGLRTAGDHSRRQEGRTMHAYVRRGLQTALMVGGGILFFAGHASAEENTTGADSALGGNQVAVSAAVPVTVSGNSISLIGDSSSSKADSSAQGSSSSPSSSTSNGTGSVGGGNQGDLALSVPVNVSGNSISVLGDSSSSGGDSSASTAGSGSSSSGSGASATGGSPLGEDSA